MPTTDQYSDIINQIKFFTQNKDEVHRHPKEIKLLI